MQTYDSLLGRVLGGLLEEAVQREKDNLAFATHATDAEVRIRMGHIKGLQEALSNLLPEAELKIKER